MSETYATMPSPVGELLLTGEDGHLTGLYMPSDRYVRHATAHPGDARRDDAAFAGVGRQLEEYFAGERRAFDLPVAPAGTPFQQDVWAELQCVGYGTTITYAEIAARIGRPTAIRAAGAANGANPISIVIPCHRVIGSNGSLTGYGGGLEAKRFLLDLERAAREGTRDLVACAARAARGDLGHVGRADQDRQPWLHARAGLIRAHAVRRRPPASHS